MVPLSLIATARRHYANSFVLATAVINTHTSPGCVARVSNLASSLGRPVCTWLKKKKGLAPHPGPPPPAHAG